MATTPTVVPAIGHGMPISGDAIARINATHTTTTSKGKTC